MTITAAYRAYVEDRQVYVAAGTLKTYAGHLKLFFDFLEERYRKDVTALSFSDMPDNIYSAYILYLRQKGVKIQLFGVIAARSRLFLNTAMKKIYARTI